MRVARKTVVHAEADESYPPHFPIFRVVTCLLRAICLASPIRFMLRSKCEWQDDIGVLSGVLKS